MQTNVGEPIIQVGSAPNLQYDADFGTQIVNSSSTITVSVQNIGGSPLTVLGCTALTNPAFQIYWGKDGKPSASNHWIIAPNSSELFDVVFTPTVTQQFTDKIVFSSNAIKVDSVANFIGTGIQADLIANSYDWKTRRIDRPLTFPIPAYLPDLGDTVILLKNTGNAPVVIYDLDSIQDIYSNASTAFIDTSGEFYLNTTFHLKDSITIPANSSYIIPVKFHPLFPGPMSYILNM